MEFLPSNTKSRSILANECGLSFRVWLQANMNADSHFSPDWFRHCIHASMPHIYFANLCSVFQAWKIYIFYSFVSFIVQHTPREVERLGRGNGSSICDKNPKKDRMVRKENVIVNMVARKKSEEKRLSQNTKLANERATSGFCVIRTISCCCCCFFSFMFRNMRTWLRDWLGY